jgi:hypothetical protein
MLVGCSSLLTRKSVNNILARIRQESDSGIERASPVFQHVSIELFQFARILFPVEILPVKLQRSFAEAFHKSFIFSQNL